ncbi:mucin TcMUCII, putative [Trypanosoma cruzi marinkellei]|uniref:Mucin TcMUCII, putative n=1 Tax=Trypanosoma cruzi marinkellei TaxID=85056 RepID=K2N2Z9_TRYCR|nr:mucin TcMUCII, putative [Trypanosoma cruzi marinkellei]
MMKNCRLLCALLVLALCCCPAVCVTEDVGKEQGDSSGLPATPPQVLSRENIPLNPDNNTNPDPVTSGEPGRPELAAAGEPSGGPSVTKNTIVAPGHSVSAGGETITPVLTDTSHETVVNNQENNTENSKNNKEVKAQTPNTTTTTTTTKAPTTTTTTTAPEAPSNTAMSTEAPTTTTTRAPSRLREIDGSLSSSAWVCAPLLLAVSALAYTAVG